MEGVLNLCKRNFFFLGLAFKLIEEAEKSWRKIRGADKIELLLKGIPFKDGAPVQDDQPGQSHQNRSAVKA